MEGNRRKLLPVLAVVLVLGPGCGPKAGQDSAGFAFYQVHFELPWKVDPAQIVESRPPPPAIGFTLTGDGHVLELLNGRLRLDGKGYGTVKAVDRVKITEEGKVHVNGEERQPDGPAPR